jgi:folate-binding Fe-S cluster repair protein YgfZ
MSSIWAGSLNAGLLQPKGRLLADFLIWREDHDYLLQLSADISRRCSETRHVHPPSKVKLSDTGGDIVLLGIAGSGATTFQRHWGWTCPPHHSTWPVRWRHRNPSGRARCQLAVHARSPACGRPGFPRATGRNAGVRWLEIEAGIPHHLPRKRSSYRRWPTWS